MVICTKYTRPFPEVVPYHAQSVEVPGTKRPGQTAHYRNAVFGHLDVNDPNNLSTLPQLFDTALEFGPDRPCLGHRPLVSKKPVKYADFYQWQTYADIDVRRRKVGSALYKFFKDGTLGGGELHSVGIWAPNCPEWQIVDFACNAYEKVTVSLYDTLGDSSVEYIINHAHLSIVFSTLDHVPALLKIKSISPSSPIKYIVSIDEIPEQATSLLTQWSASVGVKVVDFKQFEQLGQACLVDPLPAKRDQVASICYTSGTTGNPKGVVLTHSMMAMAVQSNLCGLTFDGEAVLLSYLPLAHIYERLCAAATFAVSGRVGYFSGDHIRLLEDAQILKPTFFPSVPRVLNRIYQAAMVVAESPGIRGALFRKAMTTKLANLHANGEYTHAFWDKLVFRKIRAVLGGNVELIVSGSAPVSKDVMDFLKIAFACNVQEGTYGMTENCATCNRSYSDDPTGSGTVGPPQPCNEVKLVDVPEMGYTSEDKPRPRGEVCVRGANCFSLYYKDEANTNKAVDPEGWLHTGDVGEIDDCGRLRIVDRVKNIMKLAQGEYVALEKIENIYSANALIQQLYIHGDGLQSYLVAVVVPDPVQLAAGIQSLLNKKVDPTADLSVFEPYLQDPIVIEWALGVLNSHAKKNGLKGFEMVKRLHLTSSLFSVEDGTMTPTMKIKRKDAHNKYKRQIDHLYSLGDPVVSVLTKL